MAYTFLNLLNKDGFNYPRLLEAVEKHGQSLRPYTNEKDNLRQLEDIYNQGIGTNASSFLRFF